MNNPLSWGMVGALAIMVFGALWTAEPVLCIAVAAVVLVIGVWGQGLVDGGYESDETDDDWPHSLR